MSQMAEEEHSRRRPHTGVVLGPRAIVDPSCRLGMVPAHATAGERELRIGADCVIRPFTTLYGGTVIGDRFQSGQGVSIRENNVIGDDVSVGTNAVLEPGNRIGNRVRIHTGCFLELVTVEDDVFIAPNVVFADDPHPPCPRYEECLGGAVVRRGAKIGSNSTILPGVVIGAGALVGAGSVVVRDVPEGAVVAGSPARFIRWASELSCSAGFFARPYAWELSEEIGIMRTGWIVTGQGSSHPVMDAAEVEVSALENGRAAGTVCRTRRPSTPLFASVLAVLVLSLVLLPTIALAAPSGIVPVVAVHVSEYTDALHGAPGHPATSSDVQGWYYDSFMHWQVVGHARRSAASRRHAVRRGIGRGHRSWGADVGGAAALSDPLQSDG